MAIRLSTGFRNRLLGEQGVDTGANGFRGIFKSGVIDLYSGVQPATADDAVTGTLLGRITLNGAAFTEGVATNGLLYDVPAAGAITKPGASNWQYTGLAAGTIGWFRIRGNAIDSGALSTTLPRIDGAAGVTSGELRLTVLDVAIGTPGAVTAFTFAIPAQ